VDKKDFRFFPEILNPNFEILNKSKYQNPNDKNKLFLQAKCFTKNFVSLVTLHLKWFVWNFEFRYWNLFRI